MRFKTSVLLPTLALAFACQSPLHAAEVHGIKLEDSVKVAGKELVLNGYGVRTKVIFKVYALGLYLAEKKTTVADVLAASGPKRFKIVMMRDLSGDEFGEAFLTGINNNLPSEEKTKFVNQLLKLNDTFQAVGNLKKGDVIIGDWNGSGTSLSINGKPVVDAQTLTDPLFFTAILRIWLGDKPVDSTLKPLLLGAKAAD